MAGAWLASLLLASFELVGGGEAKARVETDGSEAARFAAEVLRGHVVLMTGVALPGTGSAPAVRLRRTDRPGYEVRLEADAAVIEGSDLVRAAYDLLEGWGCCFDEDPPKIPERATLALEARRWRPERELFIETTRLDPSLPATGVAVRGLENYRPGEWRRARDLGYRVRVASTSFDDFLPTMHFDRHPEWFALRGGRREARGNFALTNGEARAAYLAALEDWLALHPEVDSIGLWPEVTRIWCEESEALGHAEAYALLWREAAGRHPGRRIEILATGLTLRPPEGAVPDNVEVRLRPAEDASGLQGVAGQVIESVVKAWEVRGARVLLEIDAAPESWCGMPWPCHEAVRANAARFPAAVLRGGGHLLARLWRAPGAEIALDPATAGLIERARRVRSWGHPRDAANLFFDDRFPRGFRIAANERLLRIASDVTKDAVERRTALGEAYLGYRAILDALPSEVAEVYRRYRRREYRRLVEEILPEGVEHRIGPALVRESFDDVVVETDRLRLRIDRSTATVVCAQRLAGEGWGENLCGESGRFFAVVALGSETRRTDGVVDLSSPEKGRLRIDLRGRLSPGGPEFRSRLELQDGSALVNQRAETDAPGGLAVGCRWEPGRFDRWLCPAWAREGDLKEGSLPALVLPTGTLLYCRKGERGTGLAVRVRSPFTTVAATPETLVATRRGPKLEVEWIVFRNVAELGK